MATDPQIIGGGVLGEKVTSPRRQLDVFQLPATSTSVTYTSDEVTSTCPITGQPDFYDVDITIEGTARGIESKSLKLYLQSFRDDGQFCEAFADRICTDVSIETGAEYTRVTVRQKPRGGVAIFAESTIDHTADRAPEVVGVGGSD